MALRSSVYLYGGRESCPTLNEHQAVGDTVRAPPTVISYLGRLSNSSRSISSMCEIMPILSPRELRLQVHIVSRVCLGPRVCVCVCACGGAAGGMHACANDPHCYWLSHLRFSCTRAAIRKKIHTHFSQNPKPYPFQIKLYFAREWYLPLTWAWSGIDA